MKETKESTPQPLGFPVWLAFVAAGLCFVAAGYLGTTGRMWAEVYEQQGVTLPWIVEFVMGNPVLLPFAHGVVGVGLLGVTRVRVVSTSLNEALSTLCVLAALGASLLACGFCYCNVLVFEELQRALKQ